MPATSEIPNTTSPPAPETQEIPISVSIVLIIAGVSLFVFFVFLVALRHQRAWAQGVSKFFTKRKNSKSPTFKSLHLSETKSGKAPEIPRSHSLPPTSTDLQNFVVKRSESAKLSTLNISRDSSSVLEATADAALSKTIVESEPFLFTTTHPKETSPTRRTSNVISIFIESCSTNEQLNQTVYPRLGLDPRAALLPTENTSTFSTPPPGSEYPSPKRHSISDWLRLDADVISLVKPNSKLERRLLPNNVNFDVLKSAKESKTPPTLTPATHLDATPSLRRLSDTFTHLIHRSISRSAPFPADPREIATYLQQRAQNTFPDMPIWVEPSALSVNYALTLGEDLYGTMHLGLYQGELVHVQCYSSPLNRQATLDRSNASAKKPQRETWNTEEVANIWLKELEVMRTFLNGNNTLQIRAASVIEYDDTLYCFTACEHGKPLVELIFNLAVDWYDDDVLCVAHNIMSALSYAHEHHVCGGMTLLDVWMFPTVTRSAAPIFTAKLGGHFGASLEFLKKRCDTTTDTFRQHIYTRYLEPVDTLTKEQDLYSFGMLIYESLERLPGFFLFAKDKVVASLADKKRPSINLQRSLANSSLRFMHSRQPRSLRVKLIELLTRCWSVHTKRRPTAREALKELDALKAYWTSR